MNIFWFFAFRYLWIHASTIKSKTTLWCDWCDVCNAFQCKYNRSAKWTKRSFSCFLNYILVCLWLHNIVSCIHLISLHRCEKHFWHLQTFCLASIGSSITIFFFVLEKNFLARSVSMFLCWTHNIGGFYVKVPFITTFVSVHLIHIRQKFYCSGLDTKVLFASFAFLL